MTGLLVTPDLFNSNQHHRHKKITYVNVNLVHPTHTSTTSQQILLGSLNAEYEFPWTAITIFLNTKPYNSTEKAIWPKPNQQFDGLSFLRYKCTSTLKPSSRRSGFKLPGLERHPWLGEGRWQRAHYTAACGSTFISAPTLCIHVFCYFRFMKPYFPSYQQNPPQGLFFALILYFILFFKRNCS